MQAAFGIVVLLALGWMAGGIANGQLRRPDVRMVIVATLMQFVLAFALLRVPLLREGVTALNAGVAAIEHATLQGAGFVFGYLGGADPPYDVSAPGNSFVFAFRILPQILVFSVLVAISWHWRILPNIVRGLSWMLRRSLGVGGALGTGAAGSIFLGMVETPLLVRAWLPHMSRGDLFALMTCGMATVAGSVMILFSGILAEVLPGALGHIVIASVMSIPAALLFARLMFADEAADGPASDVADPQGYASTMDALAHGTADGVRLVVHVGAMLIVLVSLVALVDSALAQLPGGALTLQGIMGHVFAPLAWLLGIPWAECMDAGALLGTKLILNELVAYVQFAQFGPDRFGAGTRLILTYALCGFANFGSLGIMIGGMLAMCPERRLEILQLAPWTLVSGTLATLMTGAIVGIVGS